MKVVELKHTAGICPIYIGDGLLALNTIWKRHLGGAVMVVSDENVARHHLPRLEAHLGDHNFQTLVLPAGEEHKTAATWQTIIDRLAAMRAGRDATVVALGGGVVGDTAGFAAACWMRGIGFIQAPTTLLAQVDASLGGKTGVNHAAGKNLIGAFHQPDAVIIDLDTLATLPEREYLAGLAEVVKYGAIGDAAFFEWLEANAGALRSRLPETLREAVFQSVNNKAAVVQADEREAGRRALLNFGHTFGHALEAATGYREFLHGEAVAIGMVLAAQLGEVMGMTSIDTALRLRDLLGRLGLPTTLPAGGNADTLLGYMRLDKKNRANQLRLILLNEIGEARIETQCPLDDIRAVMQT